MPPAATDEDESLQVALAALRQRASAVRAEVGSAPLVEGPPPLSPAKQVTSGRQRIAEPDGESVAARRREAAQQRAAKKKEVAELARIQAEEEAKRLERKFRAEELKQPRVGAPTNKATRPVGSAAASTTKAAAAGLPQPMNEKARREAEAMAAQEAVWHEADEKAKAEAEVARLAARDRLRNRTKQRAAKVAEVEKVMMARIQEKTHEFEEVVEQRRQMEAERDKRWEEAELVRRQTMRARLKAEAEAKRKREAAAAARRQARQEEDAEKEEEERQRREAERRRAEEARLAAEARAAKVLKEAASRRRQEERAEKQEADSRAIMMRVGLPAAQAAAGRRAHDRDTRARRQEAKEEAIFSAAAHRQGVVRLAPKGRTKSESGGSDGGGESVQDCRPVENWKPPREDGLERWLGARPKVEVAEPPPWAADSELENFMSSALLPHNQQPRAVSCPAKFRQLTSLQDMPRASAGALTPAASGGAVPTAPPPAAVPLAQRLAQKRQTSQLPGGWTVWE